MADEEKLPRYSAIGSGSYSQTYQSAACQDYASYEEDWNIILNYLYESANGNPPIPQSPDANYSADIKAANDQNGGTAIAYECTQTSDNKAILLLSTSSSIACDDRVPSTSRADPAGVSAGNSARDAVKNKQKGISAPETDASRDKNISWEHRHKCETCGRAFPKAYRLADHRRIHTGEKPFECSTCGRWFRMKDSLVSHQRVHTTEKPFKCPSCTKFFKSPSTLRAHKRTHTGERPYACEMCDYSSAKSSNLKRHQRRHKNETP